MLGKEFCKFYETESDLDFRCDYFYVYILYVKMDCGLRGGLQQAGNSYCKIYEKLSKKYDKLLENPIEEKERKELEETFRNFMTI